MFKFVNLSKLDWNVWCDILNKQQICCNCTFWGTEWSYGFNYDIVYILISWQICVVSVLLLRNLAGWKLKFCISALNHNYYWYIDACFIFKYSIQRSEFDRCANLAQSGGTFSTANGANLTLLVRQLLFFYRQNEDSKRLVSTVTYFDP